MGLKMASEDIPGQQKMKAGRKVGSVSGCTDHCRACNRHFSGLRAFDAHRGGPWHARQCKDPARVSVDGVKMRSKIAYCKIQDHPDSLEGVEVWSLPIPSLEEHKKKNSD